MNTNRQAATMLQSPDTHRTTAKVVGVLFILATLSAIAGLFLYGPILGDDYLVNGAGNKSQVLLGAFMELVLVCTAIGTAIGLFPILRKYNEGIALAHLSFRFLEVVNIAVGIIAVLALLTLSEAFVAAGASDASGFQAAGTVILAAKDWTFLLGPYFFLGVNTVMYSSLLYKSNLIPRPLAVHGLIGATLVFIAALLQLFDVFPLASQVPVLMAMPIAVFEMLFAVWLIVKGFNTSAVATLFAKTDSTSDGRVIVPATANP